MGVLFANLILGLGFLQNAYIISPASQQNGEVWYCFIGVRLCVCLPVCLAQ